MVGFGELSTNEALTAEELALVGHILAVLEGAIATMATETIKVIGLFVMLHHLAFGNLLMALGALQLVLAYHISIILFAVEFALVLAEVVDKGLFALAATQATFMIKVAILLAEIDSRTNGFVASFAHYIYGMQ